MTNNRYYAESLYVQNYFPIDAFNRIELNWFVHLAQSIYYIDKT
jgi:hypothetical protein